MSGIGKSLLAAMSTEHVFILPLKLERFPMLREQYMQVSDAGCAISQFTTMYLRTNAKSALDPPYITEIKNNLS